MLENLGRSLNLTLTLDFGVNTTLTDTASSLSDVLHCIWNPRFCVYSALLPFPSVSYIGNEMTP